MTIRIAINGYGRIGRNVLRALYESGRRSEFEIVAVNDLAPLETNAHLTRYDTVHGRFAHRVAVGDGYMQVGDDRIRSFSETHPHALPWRELGIDLVLECTGVMTDRKRAGMHLEAGARKVLISAPGDDDIDATVVCGVNHASLKAGDRIVSNASCTTNCLAPIAMALHETVGIARGLMTTVHSYTNDQVLTDVNHRDLRRARAAGHNLIPTRTGAAAAVGLVLPALAGRLDGLAVRVPTLNVSLVDLTFTAMRPTSRDEINAIVRDYAHGPLRGILGYNDEALVSSDFNHDSRSSVFDATQTRVSDGTLVKVLAWYDNEWGFSHRMLDAALAMAQAA